MTLCFALILIFHAMIRIKSEYHQIKVCVSWLRSLLIKQAIYAEAFEKFADQMKALTLEDSAMTRRSSDCVFSRSQVIEHYLAPDVI